MYVQEYIPIDNDREDNLMSVRKCGWADQGTKVVFKYYEHTEYLSTRSDL